ncbi:hypothetical protein OHV05_13485 [Kitasatospora sp. NBC_00070]|uniref:hypothetical protein n=1 Tax=Kitasatospora sp. NBC_00070 TaxID=2975962 RepID=UPI003250BE83
MTGWSDRPFGPETPLDGVGRAGREISSDDGESKRVYEPSRWPGWIAKVYRDPLTGPAAAELGRLVAAPAGMGPDDRGLLDRCTSWPASRIVESGRTVGVLLPKAEDRFLNARINLPGGRRSDPRQLTVDWLAQSTADQRTGGVGEASGQTRRQVAESFLAVGALLDRHGLVYGDWSYRNAFWCQDGSGYLIDMDSCGFGSRPWVESPGWADPLYPVSRRPRLDVYCDRYKLAMLTVRCLTGERGDPVKACGALPEPKGELAGLLRQVLTVQEAGRRPSAAELHAALAGGPARRTATGTGSANVTGARRVGGVRSGTARRPTPAGRPTVTPPGTRTSPARPRAGQPGTPLRTSVGTPTTSGRAAARRNAAKPPAPKAGRGKVLAALVLTGTAGWFAARLLGWI